MTQISGDSVRVARWRSALCMFVLCLLLFGAMGIGRAQDTAGDIEAAQNALLEGGFDPGVPDGLIGPQTTAAIRAYQEAAGLPVTGALDAETFTSLMADVGLAPTIAAAPRIPVLADPLPAPDLGQPETPDELLVSISPAAGAQVATELVRNIDPDELAVPPEGALMPSAYWLMVLAIFIPIIFLFRMARRPRPAVASASEERVHRRMMADVGGAPAVGGTLGVEPSAELDGTTAPTAEADAAPSPPTREIDRFWKPMAAPLEIAGIEIPSGGLYVGTELSSPAGNGNDKCLIDPSLPIAAEQPDTAGDDLTGFPGYAMLSPEGRLAYLQWLAGGRTDPDTPIGYVYLYFYGLERRLLLDDAGGEANALITEVRRLQRVYGDNHAFKACTANLVDAFDILHGHRKFYGMEPIFERIGWQMPLRTRLAIGQLVGEQQAIPGDWIFAWLVGHPDRHISPTAYRVFEDLRTLFVIRFDSRFPTGLTLPLPESSITADYRAASASFTVSLSPYLTKLRDVAEIAELPENLAELLHSCVEDLRPYSDFVANQPDLADSFYALAKLPHDLAAARQPPAVQTLRASCNRVIAATAGFVPARSLLTELTGETVTEILPDQLVWAGQVLSRIGLGVAPDPRFAMRLPGIEDPVILYRQLPEGRKLTEPRRVYRISLMYSTFAHIAITADDTIPDDELRWLTNYSVNTHSAQAAEGERMAANVKWLGRMSPNLQIIREILEKTGNDLRQVMGRMAIARAGDKGHIEPEGIRALRRIYIVIGLDEPTFYNHMRGLAIGDLRDAQIASLTVIGNAPAPIQLDPLRLRAIQADEERLETVLSLFFEPIEVRRDAFNPADKDLDGAQTLTATAVVAQAGLDRRYLELLGQLAARPSWPRAEYEIVTKSFGLTPDKAAKVLNEWSSDRHGRFILDGNDPIVVDVGLIERHNLLELGTPFG